VFELQPSELEYLQPLFMGVEFHLGLYGIFHGCNSGEVFVDHPKTPSAALATILQRRFFLGGSSVNVAFIGEVRSYFSEMVYPILRVKHEEAFLVYYTPGSWYEALGDIFRDAELIHTERQYLVLTGLQNGRPVLPPPGFTLRLVDRELIMNPALKNIEAVADEMCSERASVEDFLQNSFGICAIYDNEIAGMCLSEYNCQDRCEVGIITLEAYRRRGLATAMTHALIEHALHRGITQIGWHCYARNIPSVATAIKVGFVKQADYPVCIVRLPPG
jgi:GNAT superfamily N-acetyltransferase